MDEKALEFGQRVKDRITGFTGIVVNISRWKNGYVDVGVKPEDLKDGLPQEVQYIEVHDLELLKNCPTPAPKHHDV